MGKGRLNPWKRSQEPEKRWIARRSGDSRRRGRRVLSDSADRFSPPAGRGGPQRIPRPPDARLGGPAPWLELGPKDRQPRKSEIIEAVGRYAPLAPEAKAVAGSQPSGVLVAITGTEEQPQIVFTRRAWHLRSHMGEVSFPGGRFEPGDSSLEATALRESHEEIGLHPDSVEVVGQLDRLTTVSSAALIVPVVGLITGQPTLVPDPTEVDDILTVSVSELLDPHIYRAELWSPPWQMAQQLSIPASEMRSEIEITFFELVGDTLWGATARMLRNLFEVVIDA